MSGPAKSIGFVNIELILKESEPAKLSQRKLETEFKSREERLKRMVKEGNPSAKEEQERFTADLNQRRGEEVAKVTSTANSVIRMVAESNSISFVFQEAVYASARIDLTKQVLNGLNTGTLGKFERPKNLGIGFVNTDRILRESEPAKLARRKLETEFKLREERLERLGNEEDPTVRGEKKRFREDLNERRNEELAKVIGLANRVIRQLAEKNSLDIIFQEAVFSDDKADITDAVIAALSGSWLAPKVELKRAKVDVSGLRFLNPDALVPYDSLESLNKQIRTASLKENLQMVFQKAVYVAPNSDWTSDFVSRYYGTQAPPVIKSQAAAKSITPPLAQASRPVGAPRSATPLSLSASASQPSPDGVVTLIITTNNATASLKINGDEEGGRDDGRYSVRKFAQVGESKFEVVAVDRSGNTQRQTVSVLRQPADNVARFSALNPVSLKARPPRNAVAIIIGIQDYRRVSKADFANNDARRFYDYAIRGLGVPAENIKLLLDDKADDIEILGAFKNWLPLKTRKGLTDVYVFYSGHGYPSDDGASLYFLPYGVDRQFLDRSAIKQSDIVQALQAVTPKSVTLFLDACYSGQSRTGETLLAGARPIAIQPKASTFPSNFTVLSASAPEQIASSSPELKHGIFSYFLMKGMEGEADQNKDGVITVQEMQSYLSDSVGRKAMSLSRTQQPQVVGDQAKVLVGR